MTTNSFLSKKGKKLAQTLSRVDLEVYFEAMDNLYHPEDNPDGALPMNVAENQLCWEDLKVKLQQITREQDIPEWVANYTDPAGAPEFREAVAEYLSKFLIGVPVDPESLAFSGGATGVIEMTAFLLAEQGETAVIPAPSYPVYTADIGVIPSVKRFDLQTHHDISELKKGIPLKISSLEKAKKEIEASGSHFRMLVLTSPDNPTGLIYSESQFREIADWCISQNIHLIVNEIYGMSRINIADPRIEMDYPDPIPFYSFGRIMHEYQSQLLHYWYSFSKDFGISGFRIGLLHSYNSDLIDGYRNGGLSHAISNHTQWIIQELLKDHDFLSNYFQKQTRLLTEAYILVRNALDEVGVKINPAYGSLFAWIDLSPFLSETSANPEQDLWTEIYESTGILITPVDGFGHSKKGLFRLVITSLKSEDLAVAMARFQEFIRGKSN